jgi:stage IV sporulation protein FB
MNGSTQAESRGSAWSVQVARILDIPIRIHFTFLLLVIWFALSARTWGQTAAGAVFFLLLVFLCVALHELGHAAMAKRFGVRTHEIVLYPIGGIARLESMPGGRAELAIALAGPAVNLLLALALIAPVLFAHGPDPGAIAAAFEAGALAPRLLAVNALLFLFNLIPAFPMDGGRVLRALLSLSLSQERATEIAAAVGQGIAILLGLAGLVLGNFLLMFVAFFVFLGAGQEASYVRQRTTVEGRRVREAMITRFETLTPNATLADAARHLLDTHQQDFPVLDAWGRVSGVLTRARLLRALAGAGPDTAVLEVMDREVHAVAPDDDMELAFTRLRETPSSTLIVLEDGERLVGMVTLENLAEFIEVARSMRSRTTPAT